MGRESTVDLLDWCLEQMQDDNQSLRSRIRHLEELLMNERAKHVSNLVLYAPGMHQ